MPWREDPTVSIIPFPLNTHQVYTTAPSWVSVFGEDYQRRKVVDLGADVQNETWNTWRDVATPAALPSLLLEHTKLIYAPRLVYLLFPLTGMTPT